MKTSVQPASGPAAAGSDWAWIVIAAITILAVLVGVSLATMNWILIAALLALPILLFRPRDLCLGCYAFLLPFDSITAVGPGGQTLTLIAGAVVVMVLLGTALVKKDFQTPPRQAWWWASLVLWGGTTLLWALEVQPAASKLFTAVSLLLLYLAALSVNISRKELKTISLFAVAGGCAAAVYVIFQFFNGTFYHSEMRASLVAGSAAADPNYFAASLLLPLSLAVHGFLTPRWWLARLAWLSVAGTLALGIFVTMSRGAVVAIAVMILFYAFNSRVSRRLSMALIGLFVALALVLPNNFVTRLQTAAASGGAGRTTLWRVGLVGFWHYGLVGAGLNNFPNVYREFVGTVPLYGSERARPAHNIYLEVAVELGIVGLAFLLTAVVGQLRAARRCRKNVPDEVGGAIVAYEAACYSILVSAFFIGILWEKWFWLAWILLAIVVRTAQTERPVGTQAMIRARVAWPWEDAQVRSVPGVR